MSFDPVARGQHEPCVERNIRTSKERIWCTFAAIPFKQIPPRVTIELVLSVDFWLNSWCSLGGVSSITPPREILTGIKLDANKHCKFQFGDCILAHGTSDNGMKGLNVPANNRECKWWLLCVRPEHCLTGSPAHGNSGAHHTDSDRQSTCHREVSGCANWPAICRCA